MTDPKPTNGNCKKCGRPDLATRIPFDDTPDDAFCMCPSEHVETISEFFGKYHQEKPSDQIRKRHQELISQWCGDGYIGKLTRKADEEILWKQAVYDWIDAHFDT